jgi:hypothetical protein
MSTTPPEQTPPPPSGYTAPMNTAVARMPVPGNAELVIFLLVWLVLAIIWAASDAVNSATFAWLTTVLTFGYLLSRGIAKASRVLEQ